MLQPQEMVNAVRAALERRPEVHLHQRPVELSVREGVLVMKGQVGDIIAKRVAHLTAIEVLGVDRVLDELRVAPGEQRTDAEIAEFLDELLMQESAFRDYAKKVVAAAEAQQPETGGPPRNHAIRASVRDGVVTLQGTVGSLTHRRLADVLAWWTPGTCGVRNFLHVVPDERDTDAEVSDALRIVLDKDPWLDATSIAVRVQGRVVTLEGLVPSQEQARMAEQDAWYVLGVHGVTNRLQVRPPQEP
jgi:osmotically-inducible protein OsmY